MIVLKVGVNKSDLFFIFTFVFKHIKYTLIYTNILNKTNTKLKQNAIYNKTLVNTKKIASNYLKCLYQFDAQLVDL